MAARQDTVPRAVASGSSWVIGCSRMSSYGLRPIEKRIPLAYLITFRCYATWLHGDQRGSTDRHNNCYGAPFILPIEQWQKHNQRSLKHTPVELDAAQRTAIEEAIRETC